MAGKRAIGFFRRSRHGVGERTAGLILTDSLRFLAALSSCWPLFTFNSGFFAFEKSLYEEDELIDVIQSPEYRDTCLRRKSAPIDQPAINWLVLRKQRKIFNFNLPEQCMESTMAVDYGNSPPETVTSRPGSPSLSSLCWSDVPGKFADREAVYVFSHCPGKETMGRPNERAAQSFALAGEMAP